MKKKFGFGQTLFHWKIPHSSQQAAVQWMPLILSAYQQLNYWATWWTCEPPNDTLEDHNTLIFRQKQGVEYTRPWGLAMALYKARKWSTRLGQCWVPLQPSETVCCRRDYFNSLAPTPEIVWHSCNYHCCVSSSFWGGGRDQHLHQLQKPARTGALVRRIDQGGIEEANKLCASGPWPQNCYRSSVPTELSTSSYHFSTLRLKSHNHFCTVCQTPFGPTFQHPWCCLASFWQGKRSMLWNLRVILC